MRVDLTWTGVGKVATEVRREGADLRVSVWSLSATISGTIDGRPVVNTGLVAGLEQSTTTER